MENSLTVVCDSETNGLFPQVSELHVVVTKEWESGKVRAFSDTPLKTTVIPLESFNAFLEYAKQITHWIGHNFVSFDRRVFKKFLNLNIPLNRITDTLIQSRLQKFTRDGGHSLGAWGARVRRGKPTYEDWTVFTNDMLVRCIEDVEINYLTACYLNTEMKREGHSTEALRLEHGVEFLLTRIQEDGWPLDLEAATKLQERLSQRKDELDLIIDTSFQPAPKSVSLITPVYNKDGSMRKTNIKYLSDNMDDVAGPHTRIEWVPFNPGSPKQKVERLEPWWNPTVRTKGYRTLNDKLRRKKITKKEFEEKARYCWRLCEENFETIKDDAPEALRSLGEWAMVKSRLDEVNGWLDATGPDGNVHGKIWHIGAITHRCSHDSPNLGNTAGPSSPYGADCRSCFTAGLDDDYVLLGCDAAGIQLRVLAHHMGDPDYIDVVLNGDIHTTNLEALGIDKGTFDEEHQQWSARRNAKTFIYAWLLGAGVEKVSLILGVNMAEARAAMDRFLDNLPALKRLKEEDVAAAAAKGYYTGLDGRHIEIKSAHFGLSAYLQGDESVIMKKAMIDWNKRAIKEGLRYNQVGFIHDEWQTRVHRDEAEVLGQMQVDAIIRAGEYFNYNIPLDGDYRIGNNWLETH